MKKNNEYSEAEVKRLQSVIRNEIGNEFKQIKNDDTDTSRYYPKRDIDVKTNGFILLQYLEKHFSLYYMGNKNSPAMLNAMTKLYEALMNKR